MAKNTWERTWAETLAFMTRPSFLASRLPSPSMWMTLALSLTAWSTAHAISWFEVDMRLETSSCSARRARSFASSSLPPVHEGLVTLGLRRDPLALHPQAMVLRHHSRRVEEERSPVGEDPLATIVDHALHDLLRNPGQRPPRHLPLPLG